MKIEKVVFLASGSKISGSSYSSTIKNDIRSLIPDFKKNYMENPKNLSCIKAEAVFSADKLKEYKRIMSLDLNEIVNKKQSVSIANTLKSFLSRVGNDVIPNISVKSVSADLIGFRLTKITD